MFKRLQVKKDYTYGNKKNWIITGFETENSSNSSAADDYTAEVKSIAGLWRMIKSA